MQRRPITVGALSACLAFGPCCNPAAKADPASLSPEQETAFECLRNADYQALAADVFSTVRAQLENNDASSGGCSACVLEDAASDFEMVWSAVFDQEWPVGEVFLRGDAPVSIAGVATLRNRNDETASAVLVGVVAEWNLVDKSRMSEQYAAGVLGFAVGFDHAARVTMQLSSASGAATVDALELRRPSAGETGAFYILASAAPGGTLPPTHGEAALTPQCYWNMATFLLAGGACGWCLGGCPVTWLTCLCAYAACCGYFDAYLNMQQSCLNWIPEPGSHTAGIVNLIQTACTVLSP